MEEVEGLVQLDLSPLDGSDGSHFILGIPVILEDGSDNHNLLADFPVDIVRDLDLSVQHLSRGGQAGPGALIELAVHVDDASGSSGDAFAPIIGPQISSGVKKCDGEFGAKTTSGRAGPKVACHFDVPHLQGDLRIGEDQLAGLRHINIPKLGRRINRARADEHFGVCRDHYITASRNHVGGPSSGVMPVQQATSKMRTGRLYIASSDNRRADGRDMLSVTR